MVVVVVVVFTHVHRQNRDRLHVTHFRAITHSSFLSNTKYPQPSQIYNDKKRRTYYIPQMGSWSLFDWLLP